MSESYFFIGGAPKSGTTWLQRCLDLHPHITCSGEGHFHEQIVLPIGEMLGKYNARLSAVAQFVYEGAPYYAPLRRGDQFRIARMVIADLMKRRLKPGTRFIGDKTPANAKIIDDLHVLFPEMKFVAMLRDPRDVAASRLAHSVKNGHTAAADRTSQLYGQIVQAAAEDWRASVTCTHAFADRRPDSIVFVRYEDLLERPAGELRRVLGLLGAEASDATVAAMVAGSSFQAFSGGRPRGVEDRSSFYRKGVKGDWPNYLDEAAVQRLLDTCGPALGLAGYDVAPSPPSVARRQARA